MIQIYLPFNNNFDNNGDMTLLPSQCQVEANLNEDWTLSLVHPIDDEGRWNFIIENAVIKAPSFNGEQLFRIYSVEKSDEQISATAYPIFLDSANEIFITDKRAVNADGQTALDTILGESKYSGESDIITLNTAYFVEMNAISAINGDDENSFVNRWGGQITYDNYKINVNKRAGSDKGVVVEYGKNITGINETISYSDICTRIFPKAYNGYTLADGQFVDSPLINSYPVIYTKVIEYDDIKLSSDASEGETGYKNITELRNALIQRAEQEFSEFAIDTPTVTLDINICLLENTVEYKEYKNLEKITLGDTVTCKHSKLNIEVQSQAIKITYNCISQRTEEITLGQFQTSAFDNATLTGNKVNSAIRPDGTLNAEKVQGIIDANKAILKQQVNASQRQIVRAILFEDTDKESELYGALSVGTKGIEIADSRIDENDDESEWNWRTAITAKGVVSDVMVGKYIRGIAIEASKGNIAGFNITDTELSKDYEFNGFTYHFKIGCLENETRLISILIDGESSYAFYVGKNGNIEGRDAAFVNLFLSQNLDVSGNLKAGTGKFGQYFSSTSPFQASAVYYGRERTIQLYQDADTGAGYLLPRTNLVSGDENISQYSMHLGSTTYRWSNLYLYHSPNVSSDKKMKKDIEAMTLQFEKYYEFFKRLCPSSYKKINADEKTHLGFIAQEVYSAMKGLDLSIVNCEDNNTGLQGDAGKDWSLIYEEFIALIVMIIQYHDEEIQKLKEEKNENIL